jgi:hypothetical protein
MILTVNSEAAAFVRVNLAPIRDKSLQLKNHPNINKQVCGFSRPRAWSQCQFNANPIQFALKHSIQFSSTQLEFDSLQFDVFFFAAAHQRQRSLPQRFQQIVPCWYLPPTLPLPPAFSFKFMAPTGTPLPILKWKSGASADHFVPIKVVGFPPSPSPPQQLVQRLTRPRSPAGPAPDPTPPP